MLTLGIRVYGLAAIALGLVGLVWADFAAPWQPVPSEVPGRATLALVTALAFVAGGAALQWRHTAKPGALLLAALYAVFALLWAKRVIGFPAIFGTWSGMAEPVALAVAGLIAFARLGPRESAGANRLALSGRLVFGLCLVAFGTAHLVYVVQTAAMVPAFMPGGTRLWAQITGFCHLLAGLALLSGVQAKVAARLLIAMFVGFGLLVWLPQLFATPHVHMAWGGNAINFALVGAAWVVADSLGWFKIQKEPLDATSAETARA
ncbi:MAG TPA: hypothetical protein VIT38_01750 [Allosphingosinicella sp.]